MMLLFLWMVKLFCWHFISIFIDDICSEYYVQQIVLSSFLKSYVYLCWYKRKILLFMAFVKETIAHLFFFSNLLKTFVLWNDHGRELSHTLEFTRSKRHILSISYNIHGKFWILVRFHRNLQILWKMCELSEYLVIQNKNKFEKKEDNHLPKF